MFNNTLANYYKDMILYEAIKQYLTDSDVIFNINTLV